MSSSSNLLNFKAGSSWRLIGKEGTWDRNSSQMRPYLASYQLGDFLMLGGAKNTYLKYTEIKETYNMMDNESHSTKPRRRKFLTSKKYEPRN